MAEADISSKVCASCLVEKPAAEFPRNKTRGLRAYCKPCNNAKNKAWRDANPEKSAEMSRRWALANPDKAAAKMARWKAANPGRHEALIATWQATNPDRVRAAGKRSTQKRRQRIVVRLHDRIGNQIRGALKSSKGAKTFDLVCYSVYELRAHLERQFRHGMGWHNFGEWHIDHIVPVSSFILDDQESAVRTAWALPNLRPLWAKDNMSKGAKRTHLV